MAVPIVGYLILFNDSVAQHISFNNLAKETNSWFGLSSEARLKLIYFGLVLLGTTNIIYRIRRPHIFKVEINQYEYVDSALRHFTASAYININGTIQKEGHVTLHGKYDGSEYDDFLDEALGHDQGDSRGQKNGDWTAAKKKYEHLLRSMLLENYFRYDTKRRYSLTTCIALALAGYLLLLIPSGDLFCKVLVSLRPVFS